MYTQFTAELLVMQTHPCKNMGKAEVLRSESGWWIYAATQMGRGGPVETTPSDYSVEEQTAQKQLPLPVPMWGKDSYEVDPDVLVPPPLPTLPVPHRGVVTSRFPALLRFLSKSLTS